MLRGTRHRVHHCKHSFHLLWPHISMRTGSTVFAPEIPVNPTFSIHDRYLRHAPSCSHTDHRRRPTTAQNHPHLHPISFHHVLHRHTVTTLQHRHRHHQLIMELAEEFCWFLRRRKHRHSPFPQFVQFLPPDRFPKTNSATFGLGR
jgi:hypothetical protein